MSITEERCSIKEPSQRWCHIIQNVKVMKKEEGAKQEVAVKSDL